MNWLMPIEATRPQPNAKANNSIDLVRIKLSKRPAAEPLAGGALATRAVRGARNRISPLHRFIWKIGVRGAETSEKAA
jgi:hypothetical protein